MIFVYSLYQWRYIYDVLFAFHHPFFIFAHPQVNGHKSLVNNLLKWRHILTHIN
jgi:hypothetical protein